MKKYISTLHYITQNHNSKSIIEIAESFLKAGGDWIQLRIKNQSYEYIFEQAELLRKITLNYNAKLIINDYVEITKEIKADGLHLGKTDKNIDEARNLLGDSFIIGATANTFEDIIAISKTSADYIGLGPFRFTATKENLSPILGLDGYKNIINQMHSNSIKIPIVAIGGIVLNDIPELKNIEIDKVAISSAITFADDIYDKTKLFLQQLKK